ncbi:NYN domain-containing protein [Pseudodesulfovibrio indicus]|uniref:NYN domain-containing protein n=1 Tax=Pseudodesulfovibrio indicus TaxID=1716143 RepID=UPI00292E3B1F|nr:NYN domain-containing protein [Pseudodesulfovibrio indicus]
MPNTPPEQQIALFIDADNAPAKAIEFILTDLAKYGSLAIRRAYGNWKNECLKGWEECLFDKAIQPIQQFDMTKGKNATDMAMTIDAMDILYQKNIGVFGLVSSDCDFAPLATRLRAEGKTVVGYGARRTPEAFTNACTMFSYIDEEPSGKPEKPNSPVDGNGLKGDARLMNLLRSAIDAYAEDDGWANMSQIGQHIRNQSSFDPRNYGYKGLGNLLEAIDLFDVKPIGNGHKIVRDKKRKK